MSEHSVRDQWLTLGAMCFALFMIMLDNTVVNLALPTIQTHLRATPSALEWIVNGYVLSFASLILLGGKLGDRFGRKRMFIVGVALFVVFSAACALATTADQLVAARVLQGTGAALLNPLSLSLLVTAFPRERLAMAIGVWAGISGLGLAIGPVVGGALVDSIDWSAVFWINVPIGLIAIAVTAAVVRESRDPDTTSLDVVGTILITAALFAFVYGVIRTNSHSWTSPTIVTLIAVALVLFGAWIAWEQRVAQPMVPLSLFRIRQFSVPNAVAVLVGFALFGSLFFITLYLQNVQGYSPFEAGLRSLPLTLSVMVIAPLAGRLNAKLGGRRLIATGMVAASAGMLGLTRLAPDSSYVHLWPFFVVLGAGISMTMPAISNAVMSSVDPRRAGIASGVMNASRQVGGALGIAVLGSVVTKLALDRFERLTPPGAAIDPRLEQLVATGRVADLERIAPSQADAAGLAFLHGMTGAMWVGAALTLLAAAIAAVGLRHEQPPAAADPVAVGRGGIRRQ